jgi:hypothetical protein
MLLQRQRLRVNGFEFLLLFLVVSLVSAKFEPLQTASSGSRKFLQGTARSRPRTSQRRLQSNFTDSTTNNTSSAYLKCYSLLDEVSQAASTLNPDEYVGFLKLLTNGEISYDRFQDLPIVFVMIFYTAACSPVNNCTAGSGPAVPVANTNSPSEIIQLFCKQVLKSTTSTTEAIFEYTIRYDPKKIQVAALSDCLSTATVNVLLKELAGCPQLTAVTASTRRLESKVVLEAVSNSSSWASYNAEKKERKLQSLGSASTPKNSTCLYTINSTVDNITELRK